MTSTSWAAPTWVHSFYSKFPLVTLPQEDTLSWSSADEAILWIAPPTSTTRTWASADPSCLRAQLLFRLRGVNVKFRSWADPSTAPEGTLPALHLPGEGRLIPAEGVKAWLDAEKPLDKLNGLPDQASYDRAVALAQLIFSRIHPASFPDPLNHSTPPSLLAGLMTPLPASLTGDHRNINLDVIKKQAEAAWDAVEVAVENGWALGASAPTPLDALIAAYAFSQGAAERHPSLQGYLDKVLDAAER